MSLVRLIYASKFTDFFLRFAPTARSRQVVDFSLVTLEISPSYCGVLAETSWKLFICVPIADRGRAFDLGRSGAGEDSARNMNTAPRGDSLSQRHD